MKRVYETLNDLLEAAEKFGYKVNKAGNGKVVVSQSWSTGSYTRDINGGWYQDTKGIL